MIRNWLSFITRLLLSAFVTLWLLGWYFYYVWNIIQSDVWIVKKIITGINQGIKNISGNKWWFHTSFDFLGELSISEKGEEILFWKIKLENVDIYTNQTALQQYISAGNIEIQSNIRGQIQWGKLQDLDIISNEEHTYLSVGKWGKKLFAYLNNISYTKQYLFWLKKENSRKLLSNISEAISQWKYAHIDNGQPIRNIFSNLSENTWISQFFIAIITSNPYEYLEKYKIYDQIKKELYSDEWIDAIFALSENQVNPDKKTYALNKGICQNITPIIFDIIKQSTELYEWSTQELLIQCENSADDINPIISLTTQIYKKWDIENGNYDFIIIQWNAVEIKIKYVNHLLENWSIFIQDPQNKKIAFSIFGDKFGIDESKINFSINDEWININGEIINWTWEIKIEIKTDKENNKMQVDGKLQFQNYKLSDMDIRWKSEMEWLKSNFSAQWNYLLWNISFLAKKWGIEIAKLDFDYTNSSYDFDFESIKRDVNSLYIWKKFIFAASKKDNDWVMQNEVKIVYNSGKISGFLKDKTIELNLKWEIISIQEFIVEMNIDDGREKIEINVNAEQQDDSRVNYVALWIIDSQEIFDFRAFQEIWKKEGNNTLVFEARLQIPNQQIDVTLKTEKIQKKPTKKYKIPQNTELIEVKISEIITLPNFHQLSRLSTQEFAVLGVALWAIWGTATYISSQRNLVDARNSKRISDISNIANAIEISVVGWNLVFEDLVIIDKEKSQNSIIRVGWNKVINWWNYFIWDINYSLLGQNKDFFETEGFNYKIAVYQEWGRNQYQLLTLLEEGNKQSKVFVKWNYFPRTLKRYDFKKVENIQSEWDKETLDQEKENKIQIEVVWIHDFISWDNTNLWIISEVWWNVLTFEKEIKIGVSKIYILGNDSATLFVKNKKILGIWQIIKN